LAELKVVRLFIGRVPEFNPVKTLDAEAVVCVSLAIQDLNQVLWKFNPLDLMDHLQSLYYSSFRPIENRVRDGFI
jgi:hypothetical protein